MATGDLAKALAAAPMPALAKLPPSTAPKLVPGEANLITSGFTGAPVAGGGGAAPAYGSDAWALQTGGIGAMIFRDMAREGVYPTLAGADKLREGKK